MLEIILLQGFYPLKIKINQFLMEFILNYKLYKLRLRLTNNPSVQKKHRYQWQRLFDRTCRPLFTEEIENVML